MIIEKTGTAPITGYGASDYTEIIDPNLDADYVYFDSVNGAAGTDWMRGRRGYPVNNWADLVTIATARHTNAVMILNGVLTLTSNGDHYYFTGNGFVDPTALFADNVIELGGFTLTNCSFTSVNVHNAAGGILDMCGSFVDCPYVMATTMTNCGLFQRCGTINATTMTECDGFFDCLLITATTMTDCGIFESCANITVDNMDTCIGFTNCDVIHVNILMLDCSYFVRCSDVWALEAQNCGFFRDCSSIALITSTLCNYFYNCPSLWFTNVDGPHNIIDCCILRPTTFDYSGLGLGDISTLVLTGASITIGGLGVLGGTLLYINSDSEVIFSASCIGGYAYVRGNARVVDLSAVGCTVFDQTNRIREEEPVDITATNAAETDVLNLHTELTIAIPTYHMHYTVEKLRLKCADPGANTVTVRLYELINGASTEVDSFAITTVNFATYFSLMDMFGVDHLAGDNLKITVRASAGGPYAVTGSYAYRSA
jgi:hypothetical protein